MGTQVHSKSYLPGYYSMRDLNEDSNSSSWPLFYGERNLTNGQYCNGYVPRTIAEAYPVYDKDQLKQKMLEHEAVFKNQVSELHRLYKIQRDMMEEVKRTESNKRRMSIEPSSSSSLLGSQKPAEDAGKWHAPSLILSNSGYPRPSVSDAEIVNSPLYCTKGNNTTPGQADGSASKDCEILETRPSKVRKKLFDLQLPADEYIDTEEGEQLLGSKVAGISSSLPNGNHKATPEKFGNFFLNGEKITAQTNASASTACLRSTTRLADLNEPIQVEDDPVPSSVNFLGYPANHGNSNALNIHSGSNSETAGLHVALNAHLVNQNGTLGAISVINESSERDWLSGMHESGEGFYPGPVQRGNSMISPPPGFHHSPKVTVPSQPAQVRASRPHPPLGISPTEEMWRGRTVHGLENVGRGFGNSNGNHLSSVITSHLPGLYSLGNTSDVATSWSHSALSWGKPTSSLSQKMGSLHAYSSLQSSSLYSTSANSSSQSHGILGDKLHNIESSKMNGFYHGSSSGSKEILGRYPPNCNGHFTTESSRFLKPVKDMDLNVVLTKCPSDEVVCLQDLEVINGNSDTERDLKVLPWLRAKPSCKSEAANVRIDINSSLFQASPNKSVRESEPVKDLNKLPTQEEDVEITGVKKIMGVAIFEKPAHFRNESSFLLGVKKNSLIDINVAYDEQIASEALADEKTMVDDVKVANNNNNNTRSFIDLNFCVPEDDEELSVLPVAPSVAANNNNAAKILMEIDLEAPAQESEDDVQVMPEASLKSAAEPELGQENDEEVARTAAELIVELSILSCDSCPVIQIEDDTSLESENPSSECLLWLAEAASRGEMDDFEIMSLQIEEVKEEDFLPKPFIPEALKVEESVANAAPNRTRKGQSRRGRPRRDFQRDILPGLASLSRHEVTEDLQTFGGLMRATGQPWNSTLTRRTGTRNGGGRGRRRAVVADAAPAAPPPPPWVQQLSTTVEGGLEDRSLTGWGKTTRRPRRQRCPGGNPPQAALLT